MNRRRALIAGQGPGSVNISNDLSWEKTKPANYGITDSSSTSTGRLLFTPHVKGITKVKSTNSNIRYIICLFTDATVKNASLLILANGTTTSNRTVTNDTYYTGEMTIPSNLQNYYVGVLATKGTGNNIALTDVQYLEVWQKK